MTTPYGLVLCDDLIFSSKITGTARANNLAVGVAKTMDSLLFKARATPPTCVLLDLHNPGLNLEYLLRELPQNEGLRPRVIGFGSHVDVEALKAARRAGCDTVMPRSQFVQQLETNLAAWLTPSES